MKKIRKLCGKVELYIVRKSGKKDCKDYTQSKPCERCSESLSLLGFKKIHYVDENKDYKMLELSDPVAVAGSSSWGLRNLRKQTNQVGRAFTTTRCLSHTDSSSIDSETESESDSESVKSQSST